jgi:type I restriction enzyme S subunit
VIAGLRAYSVMKDSGVRWLGQVPEHWEVRRTKNLLRERVAKGHPDEPLLTAAQSMGVVRKDRYENRTVLALKDLHLLKLVRSGDFVISLRSFQGGIEYAREQGIISPAYTVLYPILPGIHAYFARLFKSEPFIGNLTLFVTGIRQGQNIDYEKLARALLPLPPVLEQAAIVRYLDFVDRRILRLIWAKQKQIKLLEEQKEAIIHRAATRGLDPNVRLKPSGVEWLGDVPEHWEVRKLRSLFRRHGSGTTPADERYYGGGTPFVMTGDLTDSYIVGTKRSVTHAALEEVSALRTYPPGSLIVAMYGATIGKSGILKMEACTNQACCVLAEIVDSSDVGYLQAVVNLARAHLIEQSYGGSQPNVNAEIIRGLRVPVPPLEEQVSIAREIDSRTEESAIHRARCEISLLSEYRTRLIADVVTGKLDVREAAARLPDYAGDSEPVYKSGSNDEYAATEDPDAVLKEAVA